MELKSCNLNFELVNKHLQGLILTPKFNFIGKTMSQVGLLNEKEADIIADYVKNATLAKATYGHDVIRKHQDGTLQIFVEAKDLPKRKNYEFVNAKAVLTNPDYAFNGKIEIKCIVACGGLHKLQAQGENINILDHLPELIPDFETLRSRINLISFQNGIQNTFEDFKAMGQSIVKNFKENSVFPLCIGLYNATNGIISGLWRDWERLSAEWELNANSVIMLRQMVITLARTLPRNVLWTHIAHSEGGLISKEVMTTRLFVYQNKTIL